MGLSSEFIGASVSSLGLFCDSSDQGVILHTVSQIGQRYPQAHAALFKAPVPVWASRTVETIRS